MVIKQFTNASNSHKNVFGTIEETGKRFIINNNNLLLLLIVIKFLADITLYINRAANVSYIISLYRGPECRSVGYN